MGSYQVVESRGADEMAKVERAIERAALNGTLDAADEVCDAVERGENPFRQAICFEELERRARAQR